MTTEEMKLALLWHFRWRMQYPLVTTECIIGDHNFGDIVAIRKTIVVEVEIKKYKYEIIKDLTEKRGKHHIYLNRNELWFKYNVPTRPNKFYFALLDPDYKLERYQTFDWLPDVYGLIAIRRLYSCSVIKRARYLTKDNASLEVLRDVVNQRLTAENIDLRLKEYERRKEVKGKSEDRN